MLNCVYKSAVEKQVFEITGKLDQESYNQFDQFVQNHYVKNIDVLLDLTKLEYISSVGLRSFISLAKLVRNDKKNINIKAVPQSMVQQLIFISGFSKLMPFIED